MRLTSTKQSPPKLVNWRVGLQNTIDSGAVRYLCEVPTICTQISTFNKETDLSGEFEYLRLQPNGSYTSGIFCNENTRYMSEDCLNIIRTGSSCYEKALILGAGFGFEAAELKKLHPHIEIVTTSLSVPIIADRQPLIGSSRLGYQNTKERFRDAKEEWLKEVRPCAIDTESLLDLASSARTYEDLLWEPSVGGFINNQLIGPFHHFTKDPNNYVRKNEFDLIYDGCGPMLYEATKGNSPFEAVYQSLSKKGLLYITAYEEDVDKIIAQTKGSALIIFNRVYSDVIAGWSMSKRYNLIILNPENPFYERNRTLLDSQSNRTNNRSVIQTSNSLLSSLLNRCYN